MSVGFLFKDEVVGDSDLFFARVWLLMQRETLEYKVVDQEYVKGLQEKYVNYLSKKCTFFIRSYYHGHLLGSKD